MLQSNQGCPALLRRHDFMNRSRCCWRNMAGNSTWKRKLLEQLFHSLFVLAYIWINLTVTTFKVSVSHQRRATMTWTCDIEHVKFMLFYDTIQMHIDKILTGCCAPVPDN